MTQGSDTFIPAGSANYSPWAKYNPQGQTSFYIFKEL